MNMQEHLGSQASCKKRAFFSQALLISFRELAGPVFIFEHNTVMLIYVPDSLSECNHGIPLATSRAIDSAKFSDCLRSKLHMLDQFAIQSKQNLYSMTQMEKFHIIDSHNNQHS